MESRVALRSYSRDWSAGVRSMAKTAKEKAQSLTFSWKLESCADQAEIVENAMLTRWIYHHV